MSDTAAVLFELGTEELPPRLLGILRDSLREEALAGLAQAELISDSAPAQAYASPRRLAVRIDGVAAATPARTEQVRGPSVAAAFDESGAPTKALRGFAGKAGADDAQIARWQAGEDLETGKKGPWVSYQRTIAARAATELLPDIFATAIAALPVDARMRWGVTPDEFLRPVRWVVLRYGEQVVAGQVLGVACGAQTHGHRFSGTGSVDVSAANYVAALRENDVVVEMEAREAAVRERLAQVDGCEITDQLVADAVCSVEQPHAVPGRFDERFLKLPAAVVREVLCGQQKYFPVCTADGALRPAFVAIANVPDTTGAIAQGCARVVQARLQDAEFYLNEDQQRSLASRVPDLDRVGFHRKLGSVGERSRRLMELSAKLAKILGAPPIACTRAAELAKADLTTDMVQSFSDLQGVIGALYAAADGEEEVVCTAIREQYLPRHAADALPTTPAGTALALAERMDLIAGVFAVGEEPSGSRDPLGVRRACIGVLRMLCADSHHISLRHLYEMSYAQYPPQLRTACHKVEGHVLEYFAERLRGLMQERGFAPDEIEAVIRAGWYKIDQVPPRLTAVQTFRATPEGAALAAADKRIRNILRTAPAIEGAVDRTALHESAELALADALVAAADTAGIDCSAGRYDQALAALAQLAAPLDAFFDQVLVVAEDEEIRHNRFRLLHQVRDTFLLLADLSRLQS